MPSLSTLLCMVSKKLNLVSVWASTSARKLMLVAHVRSVVIWVLRRIKTPMIILAEFIDLMKVIQIEMVAFYAEMPFDRFSKELRFVSVGLGDLVRVAELDTHADHLA